MPLLKSEILDTTPPHDLNAEMSVIGSVLMKPRILDELSDVVGPCDFHADANGKILAALLAMFETGIPIQYDTLGQYLIDAGNLKGIGGAAYLYEISCSVAVSAHWKHFAKIVRQHSRRRQIIHAATDVLRDAYDSVLTVDEVLGAAETALSAIQTGDYDSLPIPMFDAVGDVIVEIDQIMERKTGLGLATGLKTLDEEIGGVFSGELTLVAARPGQGKTSLALQMAAYQASRGRVVYFATLEMSATELALKQLCAEANVSSQLVRSGTIESQDYTALSEATQRVALKNFHLHDWPEIRPSDIFRAARRLKAEIIYVDYLQIVRPPDATKKRYLQVGDISMALKLMARQLKTPVVACAQVGRQADQNKEGRPRLAMLRESGDLENNADVVLLLWRPKGGIGKDMKHDAELEVAKNRKGATATIRLDWYPQRTMFACCDQLIFDNDEIDSDVHGWEP